MSAGHQERGLSNSSATETPAAGHQVATSLLVGAKSTAEIPAT